MNTTGLEMVLVNGKKKRCELRFVNHHQTENWATAMMQTFEGIRNIKQEAMGLSAKIDDSQLNLPTEAGDEDFTMQSVPTSLTDSALHLPGGEEKKVESDTDAAFGLAFTVPKVCLTM